MTGLCPAALIGQASHSFESLVIDIQAEAIGCLQAAGAAADCIYEHF